MSRKVSLSPEKREQKERRKAASRRLLSTPEFVVASLILLFWTVVLIPITGLVLTLLLWAGVFGVGEFFLYLSVKNGSHGFLTTTALYTLAISALAVSIHEWSMPLSLILAGSSALFVTDLARLNFARRRDAVLPASLVASTLLTTGAVTVVSLLSFGLLLGLADESGDRSWLWVPAIAGVLLVLTAGATFVLSRSSARSEAGRWKPGDTMLPPPTTD